MAKEETKKVITPDTERKTKQLFSFPIEGFTIEADTLEEAKAILVKKLSDKTNTN